MNMIRPSIRRLDLSTWFLIATNIVTIAVALHQHWRYSELLWIYWSQSLVIGIFAGCRALGLNQFTTWALKPAGGRVRPTPAAKVSSVLFFAAVYLIIHAVYLVFLLGMSADLSRQDVPGMLACVGLFAVNHFFSFLQKHKLDLSDTPNIDGILGFAYVRILPMHFTLLIGLQFRHRAAIYLVTFLLLKTALDVLLHLAERRRSR